MTASAPATAVLFVLASWWVSTGLVLRLVWLRATTRRAVLSGATLLGVAGLVGAFLLRDVATPLGAYLGFVCALVIWAWHELSFLLGAVTGPHKEPCPPEARGWLRFRLATLTLLHHEVALALTWALLVVLTWGARDQVATWSFSALWGMRLSAKLNVFFGVRNVTEEFVPTHLRYLVSYFRRGTSSPLIALSLLAGLAVSIALAIGAASPTATPFDAVAHTLVATLLGLGALEHLFLAVPLRDALLWRWILPASPELQDDE